MACFTRKLDDLGRISIPKEVRKAMGWNSQDEIEMTFTPDNKIILSKYFPDYDSYLIHARDLIIENPEVKNKEAILAALDSVLAELKH